MDYGWIRTFCSVALFFRSRNRRLHRHEKVEKRGWSLTERERDRQSAAGGGVGDGGGVGEGDL